MSQHQNEIYAAVCNEVLSKTNDSENDMVFGQSLLAILQLYRKHPEVLSNIYYEVLLPHASVSSEVE